MPTHKKPRPEIKFQGMSVSDCVETLGKLKAHITKAHIAGLIKVIPFEHLPVREVMVERKPLLSDLVAEAGKTEDFLSPIGVVNEFRSTVSLLQRLRTALEQVEAADYKGINAVLIKIGSLLSAIHKQTPAMQQLGEVEAIKAAIVRYASGLDKDESAKLLGMIRAELSKPKES